MAFNVMGVVESEVFWPVPGLGQAEDGAQERRIILWLPILGDHFHGCAVRQFSLWGQHHHPVLDCAFEAQAPCLAQDGR